ncbi:MBL fold metallo-hydrolase [Prauserella marina]|uniref:Glyoxylase, beta-lactamase superfamily II n=1 Tax=Prauserella marina TaxID=530584 RepID=A0A222VL48_9PSEU|nr:MBL fold metallo-hydrolase [Prauserella marina]ASR34648.1 MBL fold metallo-hydrolase [Prauserella marina]PWV85707.1 glyoxylase-like metal-dependent hydrolase (beta-lactamase superfamily II) [Prauserella marina]SDC47779.1 Glyoxylase, beta-lactamase superfamily II [Prauserella marina]
MEPREEDSNRDWTEPGIYSVAPGVYRIPLPLPNDALRAVNVYVITDGTELVLVDSGWALEEAERRLAAGLGAIGAGLGDVSQFLITHVHRDHYTLAVELRRKFGGKVALGQLEEPSLTATLTSEWGPMQAQIQLLLQAGGRPVVDELVKIFGTTPPKAEESLWEKPDEWLAAGKRTVLGGKDLDVVHTPGHTAGHVVFADPKEKLLFTGDHVLPHITPSIGFQPVPVEYPLRDFLSSLRLMKELPDMRMLPAHGPVSPSVHARADELLAHHETRLAEMGDTVAAGAGTAYDCALRLTWTRRKRSLTGMDGFNQMLAVLETGAHLDLLVLQGQLTSADDEDGIRRYAPR